MTIRDMQKLIDSTWDWGFLKDCFGSTNIEPTDIDGFVERNGEFLVIETKLPNNKITTGQAIAFRAMVNIGRFAVILIWGKPGFPERVVTITGKGEVEHDPSIEKIKELVSKWFQYADRKSR